MADIGFDREGWKAFGDDSFSCEIDASKISDEEMAKILGGTVLVRCKDCKYCESFYHGEQAPKMLTFNCLWWLREMNDTSGFCSHGERK